MPVASPYADLLAEVEPIEASVEVLGSSTRYWTYGAADAATTVLVVHGYRGEHHGLEPVVAQLRGVRVIAPDLPAFGRSTPLDGITHDIRGYARWLGAFVAALGIESAVPLGHSFGSIVVAHAIAGGDIHPSRAVLVNPIASLPKVAGPVIGWHRLARALRAPGLIGSRPIVRGMSETLAVTKDAALRRFIHDQHARYFSDFASLDTVLESFRASVSHTVTEVATSLDLPVLLIGAEKDQISSAAAVRDLAGRMPHAELVMIPDVGHLIHYEKPREAAAALVAWLGDGRLAEHVA